jgi:hypothetical protein
MERERRSRFLQKIFPLWALFEIIDIRVSMNLSIKAAFAIVYNSYEIKTNFKSIIRNW